MKILILGADGVIGRHLAFCLRAARAEVVACARAPGRLAAMGFEVLAADLAAGAIAAGQPLPAQALRLYRIWFALGWPAFLGLVAGFWLMVAKPSFGV